MTAKIHILMINAGVLWDDWQQRWGRSTQGPSTQGEVQTLSLLHKEDTGLGQKGAWDRKVIRIGTDVSMWQQQGQEAAGEQARPHQGSSERLGHLGSLRRKSSEHRGALDFP